MHEFNLLHAIVTIAVVLGVIQGACAYLIYVERKIAAFMQDRLGPNRVGPFGLLQPLADGLKFLFKEDVIPGHVDRWFYLAAPAIAMGTALVAFAVVPFGQTTTPPPPLAASATPDQVEAHEAAVEAYRHSYQFVIAPNVDIGLLFVFSISSLAVYGVILGGWSSNDKYSLLGALRSSAQLISYEIPLGLSIIGVLLLAGSLNLEQIIHRQVQQGWYLFCQPLAFLIFLIGVFAECNRMPFDLPEAEQELVGGYHTEYSALKFGMFFLGEYTHMITTSFLLAILFLGGWHFPWIAEADSWWGLKLFVFAAKAVGFILFSMLIRWTIPRFRYDQLMGLAWKGLIPLSLVNLVFVMVAQQFCWPTWVLLPISIGLLIVAGAIALTMPALAGRSPRASRPVAV